MPAVSKNQVDISPAEFRKRFIEPFAKNNPEGFERFLLYICNLKGPKCQPKAKRKLSR